MSHAATDALAIGLLLLVLVGLPVALTIRSMQRWRLTFWQTVLMHGLNTFLNRVLWRTKIDRPLPVKIGEGAIIIANHTSSFDPMFIAMTTGRLIHWMVAKEYCVDWRLGWFFRLFEQIPAGRGGVDSAAIKQAIRLAAAGKLVGMLARGPDQHHRRPAIARPAGHCDGGAEGSGADHSLLHQRRASWRFHAGPILSAVACSRIRRRSDRSIGILRSGKKSRDDGRVDEALPVGHRPIGRRGFRPGSRRPPLEAG